MWPNESFFPRRARTLKNRGGEVYTRRLGIAEGVMGMCYYQGYIYKEHKKRALAYLTDINKMTVHSGTLDTGSHR